MLDQNQKEKKRRNRLISSWEGETMPERISKEDKQRQEIYTLKAKGAINQHEMNRLLRNIGLDRGMVRLNLRSYIGYAVSRNSYVVIM